VSFNLGLGFAFHKIEIGSSSITVAENMSFSPQPKDNILSRRAVKIWQAGNRPISKNVLHTACL
jgi:hypothetical protein